MSKPNLQTVIERELYDRNLRRKAFLEDTFGASFSVSEIVVTNRRTGEVKRLVNRPSGFIDESEPTIRPVLLGGAK